MGARTAARRRAPARRHRARPADRRGHGEERLQPGVRAPCRLLACERRRCARSPPTGPRSSAGTATCRSRPRSAMRRSRARSAPALDPCAGLQVRCVLQPGETRQLRLPARPGTRPRARAAADRPPRRRRRRRRREARAARSVVERHARCRTGAHARRFVRRADQPLAAVSGRSAAGSGRAAATTSPAAPSGSAISCRT